jgi:ABC-type sulfate transport system permease component
MRERKNKMFPLRDEVWAVFLRGLLYGFLAGIVLIALFLRSGKYGGLATVRPIGFLYFLAGLEVGIALAGTIVFSAFQMWQGRAQRMFEQSKHGT